jgi:hypothetical protein
MSNDDETIRSGMADDALEWLTASRDEWRARAVAAETALAKVREVCERKFFYVRRGLHDDEGTWPVVRVEDLTAALAGTATEQDTQR